MNTQQVQAGGGGARRIGDGLVVMVGAYIVLFLLGAVEGLIGTFQYSRGPVPLVAVCLGLAMLATCMLGAWGMRSGAGGLLPAAGWFLTTLLLSSGSGGSVLITNTTAGKWFLFGGAVFAAGGTVAAFALWSKASQARRAARQPRR